VSDRVVYLQAPENFIGLFHQMVHVEHLLLENGRLCFEPFQLVFQHEYLQFHSVHFRHCGEKYTADTE